MTETAAEAAPMAAELAETLDDATLRQVFANAPARLAVPRDVGSIFKQRMRSFGGERRMIVLVLFWGAFVVAGGLAAVGQAGAGMVVAATDVVVLIGVLIWQHSKAASDFFELYATARGLELASDGRIGAGVPLFSKGDRRMWPRVLTGTIADQPASLGHYTYTDITTDSDGDRNETDFDFTVVAFTLPPQVAQRFAGVYCSPKGITFGKLQDKLAHDRGITLESVEFHKRYTLRCVDSQDDIALYELFSPPFIQKLSTELTSYWEQRGNDLVFWKKGHENEAADLDMFCLESWHVLQRYLEEWQ